MHARVYTRVYVRAVRCVCVCVCAEVAHEENVGMIYVMGGMWRGVVRQRLVSLLPPTSSSTWPRLQSQVRPLSTVLICKDRPQTPGL